MASNLQSILVSLLVRLVLCAPIIYISITEKAGVISPFLGLIAAMIIAFPLARLLAEPMGGLYSPGGHHSKPQPAYSIPQSKRRQKKYDEAFREYERLLASHPQEVKAYIEMVEMAYLDMKDKPRAQKLYKRGLDTLKKNEDKQTLFKMYNAMQDKVNSPISFG